MRQKGFSRKGSSIRAEKFHLRVEVQRDISVYLNGEPIDQIGLELPVLNLRCRGIVHDYVLGNRGTNFADLSIAVKLHVDTDEAGSGKIVNDRPGGEAVGFRVRLQGAFRNREHS